MKRITIAIDGGAGTGKGTTATGVARALGYIYVDTGAMYRAVTLRCLRLGLQEATEDALIEAGIEDLRLRFIPVSNGELHITLNEEDVEGHIRTPEIDARVARVSRQAVVRKHLRSQQNEMAKDGGVVMDGRDMGTMVVPHAELKVFLICDLVVRANRRYQQSVEKGMQVRIEDIQESLRQRDELDYHGDSPTSEKASDAKELDTTHLTVEQQIAQVLVWARECMQ